MMKTLFVALLVCVAVTAAIESAEEFGAESLIEVEAVEETDVDAKEALIETTSKLSMSARQVAREELQEAFINANFDSEWLEQQELLETKTEGSGYGEMKEIMIKVDELEKKIRDRLAKDLAYITKKRDECGKTRALHERTLRNLARRIKKNNSIIKVQQAKVGEHLASRAKSRVTVSGVEKEIEKVTDLRRADIAGYKKRLLKRLKEIDVLHKCNMLVCTEFSDFKDTKLCVEIRKNGTKTEDHPGQVTTTGLRDLLKQADSKEAKAEAAKNMEKAKAEEAAKKAKAAETLKVNAAPTTAPKETQKRMSDLLELLQSSDLPQRTYAPARRIIMMLRTGAAAKTNVAKDIKEMTLPESLVHLLQRIVDDQKRETIDYMNQLDKYHKQIVDFGNAIQAEVDRQNDMAARITAANGHIERARTDNERRALQRTVTTNALLALIKHCREEDEAYAKRREGRLGELVNIEKLRSLLRVLQNSDLPKCPGDCTSEKQGKCVWKGLYGKDSFCACTKEFYANDCNKKKCPGAGGVLYEKGHRGVCSRRGTCDDAADKGTCTCSAGYYHGPHNSCEYKVCPGNGNCNGRGRCDKPSGSCLCYQKYYGHDCSRTKCPATSASSYLPADNRAVCSGRGACNFKDGTCRCSSRYQGQYCQLYRCPGNCSGRGSCNVRNGTCSCRSGYHGTSCQYRTCPSNCSGRGRCNSSTGRCTCYNGGSGPACGLVHQCLHTWVNWTGTFAARGTWGECPHGKFLTGLQKLNHNVWSCKTLRKWCHRRKKVWGRTITLPYICSYRRCQRVKKVCDDISCIKYAQCASPCEGGKVAPIGSCYTDNNSWWRTFDYTGWSRCRAGTFMRAMLRNTGGCAYLHCIEQVQCCSVRHAAQADCIRTNWWGCLDWNSEARCVVHGHFFVSGFYRTGTLSSSTGVSGVHNLEEAWSCRFRRTSGAPMLH